MTKINEAFYDVDLAIPGFEHTITDTFEDAGQTGRNVVYSWKGNDIVEVEIWGLSDPVSVIENLYGPNLMQSFYSSFQAFADDLEYKVSNYLHLRESSHGKKIEKPMQEGCRTKELKEPYRRTISRGNLLVDNELFVDFD